MIGAITAGFLGGAGSAVLGDYESIQTITLATSQSSIDFTSIPSGYSHLQIRILARGNAADVKDSYLARFNSDTGSNYTYHALYGDGANPTSTAVTPYSGIRGNEIAGNNATASIFGASILDILDYSNTNKYKTAKGLGGDDRNGSGIVGLISGVWMNSNAISSINISPVFGTAFLQYSSFALYGVK